MKYRQLIFKLIAASILLPITAMAAGRSYEKSGQTEMKQPPAEAYTACEGKEEGDTAQFTTPDGKNITGICRLVDDELVLFPTLSIQEANHRRQPPPEAYTACEGKEEGDTASFESPRGDTVTGTCALMDGELVLIPDHRPVPNGNRSFGPRGMNSKDTGNRE